MDELWYFHCFTHVLDGHVSVEQGVGKRYTCNDAIKYRRFSLYTYISHM